MQTRIGIWRRILARNISFLFCDTDLVFLNPGILEHVQSVQRLHAADLVFTVCRPTQRVILNTGFFYARPTDFVKHLFGKVSLVAKDNVTEQIALNRVVWRDAALKNDPRIVTLDQLLYISGKSFHEYKLSVRFSIEPMMVHATYHPVWYSSKIMNQVRFLKMYGFWYLDGNNDPIFL